MFNVEWRTGVGYGDFVTGLGYAHTACLKYQIPVNINFHWKHSRDHLYSNLDTETIVDRCDYVYSIIKQHPLVSVSHSFDSNPKYRFINQLDEFNPLHGLWYSSLKSKQTNKVVLWTTRHNVEFPGKSKDPAFLHWDRIQEKVESYGYEIIEVTYRTPISELVHHINECAFGIGYDGLAHQLFKFMWKPCIVFCERMTLNNLLIPQAALENDPVKFLKNDLNKYLEISKQKIQSLKLQHQKYIDNKMNPYEHRLYNTPIY